MHAFHRRRRERSALGAPAFAELRVEQIDVDRCEPAKRRATEARNEVPVDDPAIVVDDGGGPVVFVVAEPLLEQLADRRAFRRRVRAVTNLGDESRELGLGFALRAVHGLLQVRLATGERVATVEHAQFPRSLPALSKRPLHRDSLSRKGWASGWAIGRSSGSLEPVRVHNPWSEKRPRQDSNLRHTV